MLERETDRHTENRERDDMDKKGMVASILTLLKIGLAHRAFAGLLVGYWISSTRSWLLAHWLTTAFG